MSLAARYGQAILMLQSATSVNDLLILLGHWHHTAEVLILVPGQDASLGKGRSLCLVHLCQSKRLSAAFSFHLLVFHVLLIDHVFDLTHALGFLHTVLFPFLVPAPLVHLRLR
jgi:hypothetical protein